MAVPVLLLAFAAFVALSLVRGAPYLEAPLPGGLPLGNCLVALGLCALAGSALALSARGTALRTAALASLAGAVLWLPLSMALAGNPQLDFSRGTGGAWLALSAVVVAAACGTVAWALVATALARIKAADAA